MTKNIARFHWEKCRVFRELHGTPHPGPFLLYWLIFAIKWRMK